MLEKNVTIATMDVQPDNSIILRERVAIIEDGEELSHSFVQRTVKPGDKLRGEDERVRKVLEALA